MFDKKSDYAKNKRNADSIIYTDANGEEIRLTRDDFESEEEFRKWKAWSDSQYHETEKNGRSYMDHKLPLFDEEGTNGDTMESDEANPESMLILLASGRNNQYGLSRKRQKRISRNDQTAQIVI